MAMMTISNNNLSRFSRYLWLTLGLFIIFAISFVAYAWTEKQVDRANEMRQQSFLLADELRQSSDDLTRMVRTYVITGDPLYKQHYLEIVFSPETSRSRSPALQDNFARLQNCFQFFNAEARAQ